MATKTHETKWLYAQTVNEQVNPNLAKQNHWSSMANAVGDKSTFAKANYTRKGKKGAYTYTTPYVVTAHDFRITEDIVPENAYITKVTIECRFKIDKGLKVKAPVAKFMIYKGTGSVTQQKTKGKTGWYNDTYCVYPSKNVGTSETTVEYTISGTEWNKIKYPTSQLYNTVMGIDLHFQNPTSMGANAQSIYMKWARIKIYYEKFDPYLIWTPNSIDGDDPSECVVGDTVKVCGEFGNRSHVNGGTQVLDVQIPFGFELIDYTCDSNCNFEIVDVYENQGKWTCTGKALAKNKLCLNLRAKSMGLKRIEARLNDILFEGEYYYVNDYTNVDYNYAFVTFPEATECKPMCVNFRAKSLSYDDFVRFNIDTDNDHRVNHNNISDTVKDAYNNHNNGNYLIGWELSQESQANGVSISSYGNNFIEFEIDRNIVEIGDEVEIKWTGCFIPMFSGDNALRITDENGILQRIYGYTVKAFDGVTLVKDEVNWEELWWNDHRVLSEVETDGYIIPCGVADYEQLMYEGECTLRAYLQKDIAYIGCVPIQRSHYDPDHDFSNDLVKNTSKNKTYEGKKGEYEEETSLKIKLPPRDWTTIEGLAKLDKPVPVNLVPEAFEGDLLNHRGWVELYGIKGLSKTNPLYYDGEIEVDYLTHNINSRFEIIKGDKVFKGQLPSMLAPVVDSGDEFASYSYINEDGEEVVSSGYFIVDTDGGYVYDDEAEENQRTLISIDNGQYATIQSVDILPEQSQISMEWNCSKILENRENNIRRIISLISNNKTILEYEYFDFEYIEEDEYYTCKVTCRVLNNDEWEVKFTKPLNLAIDIESLQLYRNNDGELVQEPEPDTEIDDDDDISIDIYNDFMYGSTVHFILNNKHIQIVDEGYNGREIAEEFDLPEETNNYKYNVDWINNNTDGETNEVITFFDFEVQETILTSDLTNQYGNLRISSFPIANQTLLFTRKSEEGNLYYWKDSDVPFTYIQEPFYMYFCGVDLTAGNGFSIFDLNNSYSIFYLQNGLVRIGFNRLNGDIYLSKYDIYSRQYLNVTQLHLTNYTDFTIGAYSDDKIEVKAGTTVFTMYRGHPYVIVSHKNEDLIFDTVWNQVWAETTNNDDPLDFPALWNLTNDSNLLPECVGGLNLSKSCVTFSTYENSVDVPDLTLTQNTNPSYVEEDIFFTLNGSITTLDETIPLFSEYNGALGVYSSYVEVDPSQVYNIRFQSNKSIMQVNDVADVYSVVEDYDGNGISDKTVYFYEVYNPSLNINADKEIIQSGDTLNLTAKIKDSSDGSLIEGETVYFYERVDE